MPSGCYDHSNRKKKICIRGHDVLICGRNKFGQCTNCYQEDILNDRIDPTKNSTIKQFCPRNHNTFIVGRNKRGICNKCVPILAKQHREKHKDKINEKGREYTKKNKEKLKIYRDKNKDYFLDKALMKAHKLTRQQYNEMLKQQNSICPGCLRPQSEFTKKFAVDHDHITGKIRKLLCYNCNILLGHARDSIEVLQRLIAYLKEFQN